MKSTAIARIVSVAVAGSTLSVPVASHAQDAAEGPFIEELVVTARKKSESLQDVPLSITALSQQVLERATIASMEDVAAMTPGLTFNSFAAGNYAVPTIRGVAQTDITNIENNVSTFFNGIYLSNKSSLDVSMLDLERIEVVKGPQSALYGRNSFSGSINYVTRDPADELSGRVQATLGSDERQALMGSINIPLGERASARLAVGSDSFDGTIENTAGGGNLGGFDRTSLAGTLIMEPTDALSIDAFFFYTDEDNDHSALLQVDNNCAPGVNSFGFVLQVNASYCGELPSSDSVDIDPRATGGQKESLLGGISLDYDLANNGTLSAMASYSDASSRDNGDNDFTSAGTDYRVFSFTTFQVVDTINLSTFTGNEFETEDTSLEVRYRSDQSEAFRWLAGGFYSKTNLTESLFQSIVGDASGLAFLTGPFLAPGVTVQNDPNNSTVLTLSDYDLESRAIFGGFDYDINDIWTATVEMRFTEETRDANLPLSVGAPGPGRVTEDYSFFTPRFILSSKVGEDGLFYGSIAQGVKSGGFNNTNSSAASDAIYDEESNWTYEVGYKNTFNDGRFSVSAAAYYIDWEDLQIRSFGAANLALIQNVSSADVTGFEASFVAALSSQFTLSGGYAFTDPTYGSGATTSAARRECGIPESICSLDATGAAIIDGNQLERTSQHQLSLAGEYVFDLPNAWDGFARLDVNYQSEQPNAINQNSIEARTLVNLRVGIQNDRYSVDLWAKNLTDESFARAALFFNVPDAFPVFSYKSILGERRTVGLTASVRF
ncbi:MAG: TonB-dependent receptor [Gammaproteobacteria bacterium]